MTLSEFVKQHGKLKLPVKFKPFLEGRFLPVHPGDGFIKGSCTLCVVYGGINREGLESPCKNCPLFDFARRASACKVETDSPCTALPCVFLASAAAWEKGARFNGHIVMTSGNVMYQLGDRYLEALKGLQAIRDAIREEIEWVED